jgi:hypothetical protein
MKIHVKDEVFEASKMVSLGVSNMLKLRKIDELSQLIVSLNTEIYLQRKLHQLHNPLPRNYVMGEGMLRKSAEYFLSKSQYLCENYDFASNANSNIDSIKYLLNDLMSDKRMDIICMVCIELATELMIQMDLHELNEMDLPDYLVPVEDKREASMLLHDRFQKLIDRFSNNEEDPDMPF